MVITKASNRQSRFEWTQVLPLLSGEGLNETILKSYSYQSHTVNCGRMVENAFYFFYIRELELIGNQFMRGHMSNTYRYIQKKYLRTT